MNFFIQSMDFFLRMDFCTRKTNIFVWRRDMSLLVGESSVLTNGFLYSKERRFHRASSFAEEFLYGEPETSSFCGTGTLFIWRTETSSCGVGGTSLLGGGTNRRRQFPAAGFGCRLLANNAGRCAAKDFVMYGVIIFGIM